MRTFTEPYKPTLIEIADMVVRLSKASRILKACGNEEGAAKFMAEANRIGDSATEAAQRFLTEREVLSV